MKCAELNDVTSMRRQGWFVWSGIHFRIQVIRENNVFWPESKVILSFSLSTFIYSTGAENQFFSPLCGVSSSLPLEPVHSVQEGRRIGCLSEQFNQNFG